jgi:NDP-sugar pyrophosphorylase family protein
VEAIILAGGKGERLGDAAAGLPKTLVPVAGRPIVEYQIASLADAGVERVLISCALGTEELFEDALGGLGVEVVTVPEPEPLGRGGGLRLAASRREETGPLYALNGDELLDADLRALLARHDQSGAAATITVTRLRSAFGVVELDDGDVVTAFREAPELPYWVSTGLYVLDDEAIERLPERGDHEQTTFPELAAERRLAAFRHDGFWITVNTPKDLRLAEEFYETHPELQPAPR